jgi:ABC-2 type transport system permease protein
VLFGVAAIGSTVSWGLHDATLLDGNVVSGSHGIGLAALAYVVYLLPLTVLVAFAFFLSTVTRNSAAAIVGTVIFGLAFQGLAALPVLRGAKPYLLPQQFDAWQRLFGEHGLSIARAAVICGLYTAVLLVTGWAVFRRRDVAGA